MNSRPIYIVAAIIVVAAVAFMLFGCDPEGVTGPTTTSEQERQELRAFVAELGPLSEPTPFELRFAAAYDEATVSGSGDGWTTYPADCESGWGRAAGACAPTPGSYRSWSGFVTGSACLAAAAVTYCKPSLKSFADTAVRNATVAYQVVYTVNYVNAKWLWEN